MTPSEEHINTRNDLSGGAGEGMEQEKAAAVRLRAFIREVHPGRCKMFSQGSACECPLCDVDRLVASLTLAQESQKEEIEQIRAAALTANIEYDRLCDERDDLRAQLSACEADLKRHEAWRVIVASMAGENVQHAHMYDTAALARLILQRAEAAEADAATLRQEREILRQRIGMAIGSTGLTKWNPATVLESELQKAREALTCERNARHRAENDLATLRGTKQKQPDGVLAEIQAVLNAAVGSDDANIGLQLAKARQLVNSAAALSSSSGARADEQEQP